MQIMLRTHSDLGYKQEQRFHLELGLLKLVHAQRLLPLEELLSGQAGKAGASGSTSRTGAAGSRPVASPATRPSETSSPSRDSISRETEPQSSRAPAGAPFARPSPFEADRNRKSEPKAEAPPDFAKQAMVSVPVPRSSTQAEPEISAKASTTVEGGVATAVALDSEPSSQPAPSTTGEVEVETAREAVLAALEDAGQQMLAHNLEEAEWSVRGVEVSVTVAMSQVLIDVALGAEPKRVIQAALNKATGRPLRFRMVSGGAQVASKPAASRPPTNGAGARSRAAADPIVQRMQEKFGAEIRTVIDHKNRS
jgi:DNA polymerase-3 subunit gamma/tau